MIATIDILSEVAKYMDDTGHLAYVSSNIYSLPHNVIYRAGLTTTFMASSLDVLEEFPDAILKTPITIAARLARMHSAPEKIADVILEHGSKMPNIEGIIKGLMSNPNWVDKRDDRLLAVKFLASSYSTDAIEDDVLEFIYDDIKMKQLCRYDQVLIEYTSFLWGPLDDVMSYSHGRTIKEMYRLICHVNDNVRAMHAECDTIEDLEEFLDSVDDVYPYLIHRLITRDILDRLISKYD